ncbi:Cartilage intermediate layer protein 1 [Geodia barretti]|uniref:Cartilage intermediate layer protein 1 n=1 Tax=Geodia barretti TaxID=519541 RepID=A0AA35R3L7_GEOBA|nr:Cartilage intermediate layer protein 1 [Geodia barretti]
MFPDWMDGRVALLLLALLILSPGHTKDPHHHTTDSDGTELPLHFDVPLPQECAVSGTGARRYNQGLCSRKSCRTPDGVCSLPSEQCCYEVGETAAVDFTCSNSRSPERGHMIITCTCQPCGQLKVEVSGEVVSSRGNEPLVLATVVAGGEVVTFTNQRGTFLFETLTPNINPDPDISRGQTSRFGAELNHPPISPAKNKGGP